MFAVSSVCLLSVFGECLRHTDIHTQTHTHRYTYRDVVIVCPFGLLWATWLVKCPLVFTVLRCSVTCKNFYCPLMSFEWCRFSGWVVGVVNFLRAPRTPNDLRQLNDEISVKFNSTLNTRK